MIAAPHSGSGKSVVTMGLAHAFARQSKKVRVLKSGPDYIDSAHLARASGAQVLNTDSWAMAPRQLQATLGHSAQDADLVLIEGAMGLFDGAIGQQGSSAQLAEALDVPVMLVVRAGAMAQSVGALVKGYAQFSDAEIVGCILNQVMSARHQMLLAEGLVQADMPCLGQLPLDKQLTIPSRHLGLLQASELKTFDALLARAADLIEAHVDLEAVWHLAKPITDGVAQPLSHLAPLGQHMAIANDAAFSFVYAHHLAHWQAEGAQLSFFSPLKNEAPDETADAVFLPGGYPELHAPQLAAASRFHQGLKQVQQSGALIYGECGGYMALGEALIDGEGASHQMAGLLPITTDFSNRKRHLGYRLLEHHSQLPWPKRLKAHEFHYSTQKHHQGIALFQARDLYTESWTEIGCQIGRVMGSYAHVIEPDLEAQDG